MNGDKNVATYSKEATGQGPTAKGRTPVPGQSEQAALPDDTQHVARAHHPDRRRLRADAPPQTVPAETASATVLGPRPKPAAPADGAVFARLVTWANTGNHKAINQLREFFEAHLPIWQWPDPLMAITEKTWLGLIASVDPTLADSLRQGLDKLRAGMMRSTPKLLESERLNHYVITWLFRQYADMQAARTPEGSPNQAALTQRVEVARKWYLSSVKFLRLRTVFRPVLPSAVARGCKVKP